MKEERIPMMTTKQAKLLRLRAETRVALSELMETFKAGCEELGVKDTEDEISSLLEQATEE